jgi:hypothetical protein
MANKNIQHSYGGMMQDVTTNKFSNGFYFEGKNIKIAATDSQSTGAVTNEKGNLLTLTIPVPIINYSAKTISYGIKSLSYNTSELIGPSQSLDQIIIGHTLYRDGAILFTTDSLGFDCVWKYNFAANDLTLLYLRNMGFNILKPIQAVNNFENKLIDKVYWVDGLNQMRFLNINHSIANQDAEELIDIDSNIINSTGSFELSQPKIIDINSGGSHTAGMIQYAYNLYKINSSQTKISPLSELISLNKGVGSGGGAVNEVVSSIPVVNIPSLDDTYTNIRLYAIKYTSYNEIPAVSLIADRNIVGLTEFTYSDDGNIIQSISLEEFTFLGSDIIIPKHISTKFNRMFFANYNEKNFDIDVKTPATIDFRSFSFDSSGLAKVYNNITENISGLLVGTDEVTISSSFLTLPVSTHASSNINFDTYCFQSNGTTIGGEGKFIKYELTRNQIGVNGFTIEDSKKQFFKDNEVYRTALQFYNKYGQNTSPKWINDFKVKTNGNLSNLNGYYSGFKIDFKPAFYTWLNNNSNFLDESGTYDDSLKPVGYRLLRSERDTTDRTILCQGLLNGMMSISTGSDPNEEDGNASLVTRGETGVKIPSLMRRFDAYLAPMRRTKNYSKVSSWRPTHPNSTNSGGAPAREIQANNAGPLFFTTVQYTKLMQMFSPEILFNEVNNINATQLTVVGRIKNDENRVWLREKILTSGFTKETLKINTAISKYDVKAAGNLTEVSEYDPTGIQFMGLISHTNDTNTSSLTQFYRSYTGDILNTRRVYDVYKKPIILDKGEGPTTYNNDASFRIVNSLQPLGTDGGDQGDDAERLTTVLSWGCRNSIFALKGNRASETVGAVGNTTYFEDLFTDAGGILYSGAGNNSSDYHGMIAEFTIPNNVIYTGNIYGGNSYESKKRSSYLEFGNVVDIQTPTYNCFNPGDTYVDNFKFTKLVKTEINITDTSEAQITEIVNVKLETTLDIKNRNDSSNQSWDSTFQPSFEVYNQYNRVYSQQPTLLERRGLNYNIKTFNNFDTNIISSKLKSAGETIDSWTDLQVNEVLTLDGKYGEINSLVSFNDELYAIQDTALSFLSINPRVQVQGQDGLAIQLGSGSVLDRYKYISTDSGTLNKWSVITTPQSLYYYDTLNSSLMSFKGGLEDLTNSKGLHTFFINNTSSESLKIDNPLIKTGVSSGYDYNNNDMFMTFNQTGKTPFTLSFNETRGQFISYHDYLPSIYISKGDHIFTTNPLNKSIYRQEKGDYNTFYGVKYPSTITLNVNPEPNSECIFDNISYNSEVYINGVDQSLLTLNSITAYNDHQNSGKISLTVGRNNNIRRKFRTWNALIPRQGRTRIRSSWMKLKLEYLPTNNEKLILHDIDVYYTS